MEQQINKEFQAIDTDGSGYIDQAELESFFNANGDHWTVSPKSIEVCRFTRGHFYSVIIRKQSKNPNFNQAAIGVTFREHGGTRTTRFFSYGIKRA